MQRGRRKADVDPGEAVKQIEGFLLGKARDLDSAAELVEKGANLDTPLPRDPAAAPEASGRRTVLHEACAAGDEEAIAWLCAPTYADGRRAGRGANPNYPMAQGRSMLHYCVHEGRMELLQRLCDLYQQALLPPQPGGAVSSLRTMDLSRKDDDGETPAQAAINLRRPEFAKVLIKAGAVHAFRARVYGGVPPRTQTQHACAAGEVELLDTLCELGESVFQKDAEGNTLMHIAVAHRQWGIVEHLITEKGVSVNCTNVEGQTPLTYVIIHQSGTPGFLETVATLVQKGANVNQVDASGMPALHHALLGGDVELVGKLLELGASIREPDRWRNTAIHWAAQHASAELLQRVCQTDDKRNGELDVNQQNAQQNTALHKACAWGHQPNVRILLAIPGVNQNVANTRGRTPLHEAAAHGGCSCAVALLEKNNQPAEEEKDVKKKPPPKGKKDAAPVEEPRKTEIEIEDEDGNTPLQVAMEREHTDLVEALIAAGASVRRRSTKYGTVLHQAVAMGNETISAALINGGADVHARDAADRTPLHVAVQHGAVGIMKLLLQQRAEPDARDEHRGETPLHLAAARGDEAAAAALLEAGAGPSVRDNNCRMPLHAAASHGAVAVAELLVAAGVDVDAAEVSGRTPAHCACDGGHSEVLGLLLRSGASVGAADLHGWTPLHVAVGAGACGCVEALLAAGAQLTPTERRDRTPLLVATEGGQVEAARLLIKRWRELQQQQQQQQDPAPVENP
eukprot:TRINITY_DN5794_c0_g1_i6.p1 TRINITY_DN5794_c0_g1~~TRINITY_DN5794_c0_g1_i6.p1  ORF type:complete len:741 (+),score=243.17 TRINITY_DN5794_c0_g1_i6:78-2300(+)